MSKLVSVAVVILSVLCLCSSAYSWGNFFRIFKSSQRNDEDLIKPDAGWNYGGGGYNYHRGHGHYDFSHHNKYGPQDRSGVAAAAAEGHAVESILDEGISVGRFRRQNATTNRANNNLNTCRVENGRILGQWRCDNSEIIDCTGLCNGRRDCVDSSDETVLSCRHVL